MKLIWVVFKRLDRDLDIATWLEMSGELSKLGHAVELILPKTRDRRFSGMAGVNVTFLPASRFRLIFSFIFGLRAFLYLVFKITISSPRIVIVDDLGYLAFLPLVILSRLGCIRTKFILDIRTLPVEVNDAILRVKDRMSSFVYRTAKFWAAGITVISPAMKVHLVRMYNMGRTKIGIWSSGISPTVFTEQREARPSGHPFNSGKYIILYHGIITKTRGLYESVQSLARTQGIPSDLVLVLLGSGPARNELETLVERLDLKDKVYFHDPVPYEQIPNYIHAADVGLIPLPHLLGWRVSSPLKLLEYLAMGKPVILSDIEAHRDVVGDSKYGVYLTSVTSQAIAGAIDFAYAHRRELKMAGAEARKMILEKFTWSFQAGILSRYLDAIVA